MTTLERLEKWQKDGVIRPEQYESIAGLVRRQRFSVFLELNALLYVGVLALVAGLGWTIQTYFASLGDTFIVASLSAAIVLLLYYCFSLATPFSVGEVESPNFVFDYVVYLACLLLSLELAYIEYRYAWMRQDWEYYLLISGVAFLLLAYRFDNRLVLSLALSALAGAFGLKVSHLDFGLSSSEPLRISGLTYSALVVTAGATLQRFGIKKHFLEIFLHVASLIGFTCLVSGVFGDKKTIYLLALLVLAGAVIAMGVQYKRFAFVVYGIVFGYIGISDGVMRNIYSTSSMLAYFVASGILVIVGMAMLARRFGRDA